MLFPIKVLSDEFASKHLFSLLEIDFSFVLRLIVDVLVVLILSSSQCKDNSEMFSRVVSSLARFLDFLSISNFDNSGSTMTGLAVS